MPVGFLASSLTPATTTFLHAAIFSHSIEHNPDDRVIGGERLSGHPDGLSHFGTEHAPDRSILHSVVWLC